MLVLTRNRLERIVIEVDGRLIVITNLGGNSYRARLGVEAPADCRVYRDEIYPHPDRLPPVPE